MAKQTQIFYKRIYLCVYTAVNLRKSYNYKYIINNIEISKTKNQTKRYCLFFISLFSGLSYRNTAKALQRFVQRSHVSIWKWIQKYKPKKISSQKTKVSEFIIDETQFKIGSKYI